MKIVVVAHGHPARSAGGGERAAYSLFEHLKTVSGVEPVFVAKTEPWEIGHDAWFGAFRGRRDELLWAPPPYDSFRRVSNSYDVLRLHVSALVEHLQPDVVHFHHYIAFGLDAIGLFKELSACRTLLTLHEYALICHHDGQMVKTTSLGLCHEASPAECHACFPEFTAGRFFLREKLIGHLLQDVDRLISPSRFLRDRYASWGVDPARISVVENLLPPQFDANRPASSLPAATPAHDRGRIRFGVFGQITAYKGALLLLESITHLPKAISDRIEIILFGAKLDEQQTEFQEALKRALSDTTAKVSLFGSYQNAEVPILLRSVDWMIIPSTWWENSPLVIQEARAVGTPILASNIGGMAEKVRDGIDGVHFLAGSALDLASKIEAIVTLQITVKPEPVDMAAQNKAGLAAHLRLYEAPPGEWSHD